MADQIELYAVQNSEGKWFHRKGYGGYGQTWADDFRKARVYNSIGPARAVISFFANNYKDYPAPKLVRLVVGEIRVVDETERVKAQKDKKMIAVAKRDRRQKEWELRRAQDSAEKSRRRVTELQIQLQATP